MNIVKRATMVATALFTVSALPVAAQNFTCDLVETGPATGWIAPNMAFAMGGDGTVQVNDGIIQHFKGGQVAAKVIENTDKRLVFTWSIDMTNTAVQSTRMAYRATLTRATNKIRVHAVPSGYSNDFEGRGACKVVQGIFAALQWAGAKSRAAPLT
ncbi:MAG: hypothetical protein U5N55_03115 [Cypionkella sp.]|nr:hypothetical protein [Cypionkella sp.]